MSAGPIRDKQIQSDRAARVNYQQASRQAKLQALEAEAKTWRLADPAAQARLEQANIDIRNQEQRNRDMEASMRKTINERFPNAAKAFTPKFSTGQSFQESIDKRIFDSFEKHSLGKPRRQFNPSFGVVKQPLDLFAKDASPPGVAGLPWGGGFTTPKRLLVNTATSWGMPGAGIHQFSSPVAEMPVQGFALGMPTVHKFQPR
jgi:hypothetical protein